MNYSAATISSLDKSYLLPCSEIPKLQQKGKMAFLLHLKTIKHLYIDCQSKQQYLSDYLLNLGA